MSYTRRDFVAVAAILRRSTSVDEVRESLADFFEQHTSSVAFDRESFLVAAGTDSVPIERGSR